MKALYAVQEHWLVPELHGTVGRAHLQAETCPMGDAFCGTRDLAPPDPTAFSQFLGHEGGSVLETFAVYE